MHAEGRFGGARVKGAFPEPARARPVTGQEQELKKQGYTVFAVEQAEGSISPMEINLSNQKKYAVILGNEVKGVQQTVVDQCDACIEIPQYGTKHSLNVSVTAGIIIWEFARYYSLPDIK